MRSYNDADLYLNGEDGLQVLTDYRRSFVCQTCTLCLTNY